LRGKFYQIFEQLYAKREEGSVQVEDYEKALTEVKD